MENKTDLAKIMEFINKEAEKHEELISKVKEPEKNNYEKEPSFTFTSGNLDAYMG